MDVTLCVKWVRGVEAPPPQHSPSPFAWYMQSIILYVDLRRDLGLPAPTPSPSYLPQ